MPLAESGESSTRTRSLGRFFLLGVGIALFVFPWALCNVPRFCELPTAADTLAYLSHQLRGSDTAIGGASYLSLPSTGARRAHCDP